MKSKKIIISIAVLALVAIVYFLFINDKITIHRDDGREDFEDINFDELSFLDANLYASILGDANLPEIDLGESLDFSVSGVGFGEMEESDISFPEISTENINFNFSFPDVGIAIPQSGPGDSIDKSQEEPPETWTPNASDCALFATAPDCSYVPVQNREMCEACKAAGF